MFRKNFKLLSAFYRPYRGLFAADLICAMLVCMNFANSTDYALCKPLIPEHHMRAHNAANYNACQ